MIREERIRVSSASSVRLRMTDLFVEDRVLRFLAEKKDQSDTTSLALGRFLNNF